MSWVSLEVLSSLQLTAFLTFFFFPSILGHGTELLPWVSAKQTNIHIYPCE